MLVLGRPCRPDVGMLLLAALLLATGVVVYALELLVIVFHQRIQRTGSRVAGFIDSRRCGLHILHNRQGWKLGGKIDKISFVSAARVLGAY